MGHEVAELVVVLATLVVLLGTVVYLWRQVRRQRERIDRAHRQLADADERIRRAVCQQRQEGSGADDA